MQTESSPNAEDMKNYQAESNDEYQTAIPANKEDKKSRHLLKESTEEYLNSKVDSKSDKSKNDATSSRCKNSINSETFNFED